MRTKPSWDVVSMIAAVFLVAGAFSASADTTVTCSDDTDLCQGLNSRLFAIAHDAVDYENTILYRVTIPPQSTGTKWGDGHNGFFFRATVSDAAKSHDFVPFNGLGVGDDGQPAFRPFSFVLKVDASDGTDGLSIEIQACSTDYATSADCATEHFKNTYSGLPVPQPPDADWVSLLTYGFAPGFSESNVSVMNNGVYADMAVFDGFSSKVSANQDLLDWLYEHLVFYDDEKKVYKNDLYDTDNERSVGVLAIAEAGVRVPGSSPVGYQPKYGQFDQAVRGETGPKRQYFFYSRDVANTTDTKVSAVFLADLSNDCPGYVLNGDGSDDDDCLEGASPQLGSSGSSGVFGASAVITLSRLSGRGESDDDSGDIKAGDYTTREVKLEMTGSNSCTEAMNPLGVQTDTSAGLPNYVIDNEESDWHTGFHPALYAVVPAGFGPCDITGDAPFCMGRAKAKTDYVAYVPHYLRNQGGGSLSGGSTTSRVIDTIRLADFYKFGDLGASSNNSLVWFDNCGYGHIYTEASGTLSGRHSLPDPAKDFKKTTYTITNEFGYPIVLVKHCCANFYQEHDDPYNYDSKNEHLKLYVAPDALRGAYEPDDNDGFGTIIPPGSTFTYDTLFAHELMGVYNAATGNLVMRFQHHQAAGSSSPYACTDPTRGVLLTGSDNSYRETLGSTDANAVRCGAFPECPFGTERTASGPPVVCSRASSDFILGLPDWVDQRAPLGPIQLRAWGGKGDNGSEGGGTGGPNGFALTVMQAGDFSSRSGAERDVFGLHLYLGESGGSSTILGPQALSKLEHDFDLSQVDPTHADILLIAGGGGQASSVFGSETCIHSGNGGAGGIAIANSSTPVAASKAGASGAQCTTAKNGTPISGVGTGGNSNGSGNAGSGDVSGKSGIGGYGRGDLTKWVSDVTPVPLTWSSGNGAHAPGSAAACAGGGGAGYGGGGAGNGTDGYNNHVVWYEGKAGGGGGSWAAANTATDPTAPVYNLREAVAYPAKLTSTSHPQPTDCLSIPQDYGYVLDNGILRLEWQKDGNLVLRDESGNPHWESGTAGKGATAICFQGDGNLVMYPNKADWATDTADGEHGGCGGRSMKLQTDCNLVIVDCNGNPLPWETGTNPCPAVLPSPGGANGYFQILYTPDIHSSWAFNEGSGDTAKSVGLSGDATLYNSTWANAGATAGSTSALVLNGKNAYARIPNGSLETDGDQTVALWVKIPPSQVETGIGSTASIAEKWSGEGGHPYPYVIRVRNQVDHNPGQVIAAVQRLAQVGVG